LDVTWGKGGPHSGYRHLADKDEVPGSSPGRPTSENAFWPALEPPLSSIFQQGAVGLSREQGGAVIVIGADWHKRSHTVVAVDEVGRRLGETTVATTSDGHLALLRWSASWPQVRFALEDCRHLTARLSGDPAASQCQPAGGLPVRQHRPVGKPTGIPGGNPRARVPGGRGWHPAPGTPPYQVVRR
jgi:hypothetical protein